MPNLPSIEWKALGECVRSLVPESKKLQMSDGTAQIKWVPPSRLVLIGGRHVQALLREVDAKFEIRFERLFAEGGQTNWEPTPGSTFRGPEVWAIVPVEGSIEMFWRYDNLPPLKSDRLAAKIVEHLKEYYEAYVLG
jgi:hypothetical protein